MGPVNLNRGTAQTATAGLRLQYASLDHRRVPFYLYTPPGVNANTPILVCIHGIKRGAESMAESFKPLAEALNSVLICPQFTLGAFPKYQSLSQQADLALQVILAQVADEQGASNQNIHLFGFSGGAQFAHRYAMLYPETVSRMALVAAGWYTFPDVTLKFPRGIR